MPQRVALYALLACLTSPLQFHFYDCSSERAWSFVAGALTIVVALLVVDRVYAISVSKRSGRARLALGAGVTAVGGGTVWLLASITTITHLCG